MSGLSGLSDEIEEAMGRPLPTDLEVQSSEQGITLGASTKSVELMLSPASDINAVHLVSTGAASAGPCVAECSHPVRFGNLCVKCAPCQSSPCLTHKYPSRYGDSISGACRLSGEDFDMQMTWHVLSIRSYAMVMHQSQAHDSNVTYTGPAGWCGKELPPDEEAEPSVLSREERELILDRSATTKKKRSAIPLVECAPRNEAQVVAKKLMKVSYMGGGIKISADDAARAGMRARTALVESKKLMLVLDLDHTLLNSKADMRLELEDRNALKEAQGKEEERMAAAESDNVQRLLFHLPHRGLWTKLRPGVFELLSELEELYDLHVYTMGDRVYAHEMASLLDRTGQKFKNKIISRNDSLNERQKDLRLLLGAEDMVLIVDDTVSVWSECSQNIMQVERYHYFPPSPDRNAPPTASLLRQRSDENPQAGQLRRISDVLKELHRRFYSEALNRADPDIPAELGTACLPDQRDARTILAEMRREILTGCTIVFSKVIPLDQQKRGTITHPLWMMAQQLGARCNTALAAETTHVVTLSVHTDKAQQARRSGLHVVHPSWLAACFFQWQKVDETLHPAPQDGDGLQYMRNFQLADMAAVAAAGGGSSSQQARAASKQEPLMGSKVAGKR